MPRWLARAGFMAALFALLRFPISLPLARLETKKVYREALHAAGSLLRGALPSGFR